MNSASEAALRKIEQVLSRDPVLRDVLARSLPRGSHGGRYAPNVDVIELDDRFVLLLDVPGVPKASLGVELDGTKLVVTGDKPLLHPDGGRAKVGERESGAFRREFLLPCLVDGNAVTAKLTDGVLRIEVPRGQSSKPIPVDVG